MTDSPDISFTVAGPVATVTLDRPKALNALTLGMIRSFEPRLKEWAADPAIRAVVIRGAGDRAFCAGGDVRAVWEDGKALREGRGDGALTRDFFSAEYGLNRHIHCFPKPFVALIDGFTMGGGVGLSVHGSHRVATERTVFAMPETGIGLFPDVGGSWFLPRCPGRIGTYMGLTGVRLGAADLAYAGLATHVVPAASLGELTAALERADWQGDAGAVVDRVLAGFARPPGDSDLARHRAAIDRCFAADRIEDILDALRAEGTEWAAAMLDNLAKMSPTSLKVTLREIRLGAALDFDACMTMEYRLSQGCMSGHDFYEGIRALLVDKDRSPHWKPARLDEVGDAEIDRHFSPPGVCDLVFTD